MSARAGTPALRCLALPPPPRAPPPTRGHHPHPPPSVRSGPVLRSPRRHHPALAIPCSAPAPGPSEAPGRAPSPTPGPIVLGHPPTTRSRDVCRLSASAAPPPGSEGSPQPPLGPPPPPELSKRTGVCKGEGRKVGACLRGGSGCAEPTGTSAAGRVIHASRCRRYCCCRCRRYRCCCCEVGLSPPPWP